MFGLNSNTLIEALSQLTDKQKKASLLISYHQFAEMTNISSGLDHLGNLLIAEVTPVITVPETDDPDNNYIQIELFPKSIQHKSYYFIRNNKEMREFIKSDFYKQATIAGKHISRRNSKMLSKKLDDVLNEDDEDSLPQKRE